MWSGSSSLVYDAAVRPVWLVVALAACGDEGPACEPDTTLLAGPLGGPYELDLPQSCEGALTVQVVGNLIVASDDLRGLLILRDPALPP